jgi:hypothetical protein
MEKIFHLFVSSTFSDFRIERNLLQANVFPEVEKVCASRGWKLSVTDLRWGISTDDKLNQSTVEICLREVDYCRNFEAHGFIIMIGNRYGWCPLPEFIPVEHFKTFRIFAKEQGMLEELEKCYQLDKNQYPPTYRLLNTDSQPSWEIKEPELRFLFRKAVETSILPDLPQYSCSITEQEIIRALGDEDMLGNPHYCFCFFRDISNLDEGIIEAQSNPKGNGPLQMYKYVDWDLSNEDYDFWPIKRLGSLRTKLENIIPPKNQKSKLSVKINWKANPSDDDSHMDSDYLNQFEESAKTELSTFIIRILDKISSLNSKTRNNQRVSQKNFPPLPILIGRDYVLKQLALDIKNHNSDSPGRSILLKGEVGSGKTAVMATAAWNANLNSHILLIRRFIGLTPDPTDASLLIRELLIELPHTDEQYISRLETLSSLLFILHERLAIEANRQPIVIFLDGIEQIADTNNRAELVQILSAPPKGVLVVFSTTPEGMNEIEKAISISYRFPGIILFLDTLKREHGMAILENLLRSSNRCLSNKKQMDFLLDCFEAAGCLPLYLVLVAESARKWPSYLDVNSLPIKPSKFPLFLYSQWQKLANRHGKILFTTTMGLIKAAKEGLSENELASLLSNDNRVFKEIASTKDRTPPIEKIPDIIMIHLWMDLLPFLDLKSHQSVKPSLLLSFRHSFIEKNFSEWFQKKNYFEESCAKNLACYFLKQPIFFDSKEKIPNLRRLMELPHSLIASNKFDTLKHEFMKGDFIQAAALANQILLLGEEIGAIKNEKLHKDSLLKLLANALVRNIHIIHNSPLYSVQILYNHFQQIGIPKETSTLLANWSIWCRKNPPGDGTAGWLFTSNIYPSNNPHVTQIIEKIDAIDLNQSSLLYLKDNRTSLGIVPLCGIKKEKHITFPVFPVKEIRLSSNKQHILLIGFHLEKYDKDQAMILLINAGGIMVHSFAYNSLCNEAVKFLSENKFLIPKKGGVLIHDVSDPSGLPLTFELLEPDFLPQKVASDRYGSHVAIYFYQGAQKQMRLVILKIGEKEIVPCQITPIPYAIQQLCFSPDGKNLGALDTQGWLHITSVDSNKDVVNIKLGIYCNHFIWCTCRYPIIAINSGQLFALNLDSGDIKPLSLPLTFQSNSLHLYEEELFIYDTFPNFACTQININKLGDFFSQKENPARVIKATFSNDSKRAVTVDIYNNIQIIKKEEPPKPLKSVQIIGIPQVLLKGDGSLLLLSYMNEYYILQIDTDTIKDHFSLNNSFMDPLFQGHQLIGKVMDNQLVAISPSTAVPKGIWDANIINTEYEIIAFAVISPRGDVLVIKRSKYYNRNILQSFILNRHLREKYFWNQCSSLTVEHLKDQARFLLVPPYLIIWQDDDGKTSVILFLLEKERTSYHFTLFRRILLSKGFPRNICVALWNKSPILGIQYDEEMEILDAGTNQKLGYFPGVRWPYHISLNRENEIFFIETTSTYKTLYFVKGG